MSLKLSKFFFGFLVVVLTITTAACGTSQVSVPTVTEDTTETPTSIIPTANVQSVSLVQSATPAIQVTPSPTSDIVEVTAVNGELSVRTGPDISFDAIAKLKDGETVTALARSIMDGWVQIQIPSQAGQTGWISIQTKYSIVNGNVLDLPRIDVVEWNVGSYLNNCTSHQMIVKPGDVIIQPVGNSADNRVWFSPGSYSVYDLDVAGQPVVANLRVLGHSEYRIRKDGNGQRWDCR
jgi:hypothetical protein